MARKKKYPYKYVRPEELDEYRSMNKDALIHILVQKNALLVECTKAKSESTVLKDMTKEIAEYRQAYNVEDIENCEKELKTLKEKRDEVIEEDLAELKDLKAGMTDAIKANAEYVKVLLSLLPKTN